MLLHRTIHAKRIAVLLLALFFPLLCPAQTPYTLKLSETAPGWRLSVQPESDTSCTVVVRDTAGILVDHVQVSHLVLTGEKKGIITSVKPLQETQEAEFRVVLVVDNSASMLPRLDKVFRDMNVLMGELSNNIDISVVSFSDEPMILNGQKLHVKASPFIRSIARVKELYGKAMKTDYVTRTFLYDAVYAASVLLKERPAENGKALKTYVILISDGRDIGSEVSSEQAINQIYSGGNAPVFYTVDYLTASNKFLQAIAEKTGGKYYAAKRADDLADIFAAVARKTFTAGHRVTFSWSIPPAINFTELPADVAIERSVVNEAFPLLPYVFFDENSADIPARYHLVSCDGSDEFAIDGLPPSALEYYYHVLNIIGSRLKAHPKAKITVTGCNSDAGVEKGNLALSQARARAVVDYLTSVWNIAPGRISVKHRNLPETPSNIRSESGIIDNRRVEILSDTWEVIKPIVFSRTSFGGYPNDHISTIQVALHNVSALREYRWSLRSDTTVLYTGTGSAKDLHEGSTRLALPWSKIFMNNAPGNSVQLYMQAYTATNDSAVQSATIPLNVRSTAELRGQGVEKHRISLMLFDFDRSELTAAHTAILKEFVLSLLKPTSTVVVSGHTDNLGSSDINISLSLNRAKSVSKALRTTTGNVNTVGKGFEDPIFTNSLPEGRFYNRTVVISIETPVGQ